jgi:outer membrane protein insertion porin family
MRLKSIIHATLAAAAAGTLPAAMLLPSHAMAQVAGGRPSNPEAEFTVGDIRIEGLQRISEGTVYNYLPINIGDRLDDRRIAEALRAMYQTGFFRDVEIRRDGGTLVVAVLERPSIESFEIKGNKDIKTEDLQKSLRNVGLATGKTFDQSVLDEVKQYLTDQYFSRGKYAVRVDAKVEEVPGNKVKLTIDVHEGKRARIRQINIAGNTAFTDKELQEDFELHTPNWLSWYKQDDRYAREALSGDLEKLRSYYMDRGYANFHVTSTQVAIAPEKDDIFVTVNVDEGEVFKISEIKLAGNMVVPEEQLRHLIFFKPGDTYSLRQITATTEAMKLRLGVDGYAFATIDPVPQANNDTKEIALTFVIDPKNRVYVRRVNFNGTSGVNDEVFRREMRQFEGAYLSNSAVERSKQRIQRLPFIEKVAVETNQVPGAADLVDVDFDIKEGLPGQFGGGIGYSESQSIILNGNFVHSNFMGTGNRIAAEVNSGRYAKAFSFSHSDRYTTIDEVQRTISLGYRDVTQFTSATSDFDTETITLGVNYDWPITEYQYLGVGLSAQRAELVTSEGGSAEQATDWVRNNGNAHTRCVQFVVDSICDRSIGEYQLRVRHARIEHGLALRLAQPRDLRRPRRASSFQRQLHGAGQRRGVLDRVVRLPAVRTDLAQLHAYVQRRARLRFGARRYHGVAAVPSVFCRWPGFGPRLSREPPGPQGQFRPSLRRQLQSRGTDGAAAADAGEVAQQRPFQPVLRHGQRVLGPEHQILRPDAGGRNGRPGRLQLQL